MKRVLVCITPQANGRRLIDKGYEISLELGAELHILHVEQNSSVFYNEESSKLLEWLFTYGSERGGVVHGICGKDPFLTIKRFIREYEITNAVLGESPNGEDASKRFINALPYIQIHVLERERTEV